MFSKTIIIRNYGLIKWKKTFFLMNKFIDNFKKNKHDEIWFVEHYPVYTTGLRNITKYKNTKIKNIPLFFTDRGGDITFHGPGQQTIYFLINLLKNNICIRKFLKKIIKSTLKSINFFFLNSYYLKDNPGFYIKKKKVCSIGLKIKKGYSMHGISVNINTNLKYFKYIYPCGQKKLKMENLLNCSSFINMKYFRKIFIINIMKNFNYNNFKYLK